VLPIKLLKTLTESMKKLNQQKQKKSQSNYEVITAGEVFLTGTSPQSLFVAVIHDLIIKLSRILIRDWILNG